MIFLFVKPRSEDSSHSRIKLKNKMADTFKYYNEKLYDTLWDLRILVLLLQNYDFISSFLCLNSLKYWPQKTTVPEFLDFFSRYHDNSPISILQYNHNLIKNQDMSEENLDKVHPNNELSSSSMLQEPQMCFQCCARESGSWVFCFIPFHILYAYGQVGYCSLLHRQRNRFWNITI